MFFPYENRYTKLRVGALYLASQGYTIFPQRGRTSLLPDWSTAASSEYSVVKAWWQKWPNANIGCVTGRPSNVIVLDVDIRKGSSGRASLYRLKRSEGNRETLKQITPFGHLQIFFKYPRFSRKVKNLARLPGFPGIALIADGGVVTMAPSPRYVVISQVTVPMPCPGWVLYITNYSLKPLKEDQVYGKIS